MPKKFSLAALPAGSLQICIATNYIAHREIMKCCILTYVTIICNHFKNFLFWLPVSKPFLIHLRPEGDPEHVGHLPSAGWPIPSVFSQPCALGKHQVRGRHTALLVVMNLAGRVLAVVAMTLRCLAFALQRRNYVQERGQQSCNHRWMTASTSDVILI